MVVWDENMFEMTHRQRIVSMILGTIVGGSIAGVLWYIVFTMWLK